MSKILFQFPLKGKDVNWAFRNQPTLTSPDLENVRPQDVYDKRIRGGQRPAVRKWSPNRIGDGNFRIDRMVPAPKVPYVAGAPVILTETPTEGSISGGTDVTVTGTDLDLITAITFGGTAATIKSQTSTEIVVTSPAHAAGLVDKIFTYPDGEVIEEDGFLYLVAALNLFVVGVRYYHSVWRLYEDGTSRGIYDTGGNTKDIIVDSANSLYVGGVRVNDYTVWKMDASGSLDTTWGDGDSGKYDTGSADANEGARGVAVDASKNCYIAAERDESTFDNLYKLDANGDKVWSVHVRHNGINNVTYDSMGVGVDSSGDVFRVGDPWVDGLLAGQDSLFKMSGVDGSYIAEENPNSSLTARVDVDASDNIYVSGNRTDSESVWSYENDFTARWTYDTGERTWGVLVIPSVGILVTGKRSGSKSVWLLDDSDGSLLYNADTGANTWGAYYDGTYIYIVGDEANNKSVWKLDTSLEILTSWEVGTNLKEITGF